MKIGYEPTAVLISDLSPALTLSGPMTYMYIACKHLAKPSKFPDNLGNLAGMNMLSLN